MSRRTYPRHRGARQLKQGDGKRMCKVIDCGKPATRRVEIEFSYMRGEDESTDACEAHTELARTDPIRFVGLVPTGAWK
ncbi:hypothetical protein UFOVP119_55 [uncultured Caudovirales phage]|uniref:Uncharacterized protein n=1 Tax=uncultured Caudovirales phage TaxID=2100421 RepID=A0A6J5L7L7_9CAUD|nr:hypothetical protein UFOVP119_55 [uncultured Caudovirales phage]